MTYYSDDTVTLHHGNSLEVLRTLPSGFVDCCVTSPPYWGLRDYGVVGQIGAEATPAEYVANLRDVFREVRRVLADDGTCWINLGDSFSHSAPGGNQGSTGQRASRTFTATGSGGMGGLPDKNLMFMPHRVAMALQDDGWIARNAVVWNAPNRMPESVTDRLSTRYEMVFMFSKSRKYWFNLDPIRDGYAKSSQARSHIQRKISPKEAASVERGDRGAFSPGMFTSGPGPNPGDVWDIATTPFVGVRTSRPVLDPRGPDGSAYGMQRTESPTCPVHGSEDLPGSSDPYGAHVDGPQSCIADTDGGPAPTPEADSAPTQMHPEMSNAPCSSDSTHPGSSPTAIAHSNRTHKTARAPATTQPYTPGAQTPNDTEYSGEQLAFAAQHPNTSGSNKAADDCHVVAETALRTIDRCTCSWVNNTKKLDHFAVFPPELPRRCIVAGCKPGGTVLDPFHGSGTTGMVATRNGRKYVGIELNKEYLDLSLKTRLSDGVLDFEVDA